MDDKELKNLFADFNPELSSGQQFMEHLQQSLATIELVRAHTLAMKRRNRQAVTIAAVCGFVMGVVVTMLVPIVSQWLGTLSFTLNLKPEAAFEVDYTVVGWILAAGVCMISALNAYEIALAKLPLPRMADES